MKKSLLNKAIDLQIISKIAYNQEVKEALEDKYFNNEIRVNQAEKSIIFK